MDRLVDFMNGDVVRISSNKLKEMEQIAMSNPTKKRYRICLHDSPENRQHEMLICTTRNDYSRPHKHVDMSETHIIIEGREKIILFNDLGDVKDCFILDRNDGDLCYRINMDIFHMSIPLTDTIIEIEVKGGPFTSESNVYPDWAPDGNDLEEAARFVKRVLQLC